MRQGRLLAAVVLAGGAVPPAAFADFADEQAVNYTKHEERSTYEHGRPDYRMLLAQQGARNMQDIQQIRRTDPERESRGNLCSSQQDGCAGDVRLYNWDEAGFGIVQPVLYTARSGATISGHVWATARGPRRRPGVVVTTGSVQAPEVLYLWVATTLAKRGYVVLTYDVQGQGRSDTNGEDPDRNENVPAQQASTFVDGTEDALDFFVSTAARPYRPRPSRTTGTVHLPKHERRVKEGRNTPFNPFHRMLKRGRLGIAGHSLGAFAVSQVGSTDRRVDAIVAWDNLRAGGAGGTTTPTPGSITPRVPALGMSADYGLFREPLTVPPDPQAKSSASNEYSARGIDTAQINIRGGTHYEWSYIPNPYFGATLRGMDMAAWYTAAWFDKYLKRDPKADARLLTRRWHADRREAEVDPNRDGNMFSSFFRSRIDVALAGGGRARCEDLRSGCPALVANDGEPPDYSYLEEARTPDGGGRPYNPVAPPSGRSRTPLRDRG